MAKEELEILKGEISDRLIKALDYNGVNTAAELARILGSSHPLANNYFKGERVPTMEYLSKLTQEFKDLNVRWILTGEGNMLLDRNAKQVEISDFSDNEILVYLASNKDRFKKIELTRRVFDAMFIDEWMDSLRKESERLKEVYNEKI